MSALTRRLTGLAAVLGIVAFLVGVPALLVAASRAFLPDELPTLRSLADALLRPDDGSFLVALLVVAGWLVWGALVVLLLIEVAAALRGVTAPTLPGLRAPQHAIRKLVATAALAFLVVPATGQAALAAPGTAPTGPAVVNVASDDAAPGVRVSESAGGAGEPGPAAAGVAGADAPGVMGADAVAVPAATEAPAEAPAASDAGARRHVVEPGESLWSIAERELGDGRRFAEIAALNRDVLGPDPGFLRAGWELRLPGAAAGGAGADARAETVTVVHGDTLWDIADEHLGEPERYPEIAELNDIPDPDLIHPGEVFALPAHAEPAHTEPAGAGAVPAPPAGAVRDDLRPAAAEPAAQGAAEQSAGQSAGQLPAADPAQGSAAAQTAPGTAGQGAAAPESARPDAPAPTSGQEPAGDAPGTAARVGKAADLKSGAAGPARAGSGMSPTALRGAPVAGQAATPASAPHDPAATADADLADEDAAFPTRTLFGLGGLAAAGVVASLAARRTLQQRRRRSGERTPVASAGAAATERELRAVADADGVVVIDRVLRHLARACHATGTPLPELYALRLTDRHLVLRLAAGATLPAPWIGEPGSLDWAVTREDALALDPAVLAGVPAPYPALVTLGHDDDGHLLIDLEKAGSLGFLGDQRAVRSALAALTLELATSAWADDLQVTVAGTLSLLAESLDNGRLRYVPTVAAILQELEQRAAADRDLLTGLGADGVHQARRARTAEGTWTPEIVVVAAPTTPAQEERMTQLVSALPDVALAFVTTGTPLGEWHVTISGDLAVVAPLGLPLHPQLLPFDRLDDAQELFAVTGQEEPMTVVDETAAARPEITVAEIRSHAPAADDAAAWPVSDPEFSTTGTPAADASAADPATKEGTRMEAIAETPADVGPGTLDDGALFVAPHLRLLGPIRLEAARGPVEPKKRGSLTELCAYLALNPGATSEALDESVWPARPGDNTSTRTTATSKLRRWLAKNPEGEDFFPAKGSAGYVLDPRITTDIHRWDQLVGGRPETAATTDLHDALLLVRGRPFLDRGRGRYSWADPLEQRLIDEISEAAHELARRRIAEGRWRSADAALAVGILVDPTNERLLRLRIRIAQASHDPQRVAEARARLETIAQVLDCDLEPETEELLAEIDAAQRAVR